MTSNLKLNTIASDSIQVATAALTAAASEAAVVAPSATASALSTGTSLLGKVEKIIGNAEAGVETFFAHNTTLKPVADALVTYGETFAAQHGVPVSLVAMLLSGVAGLTAQVPASTVTVPTGS